MSELERVRKEYSCLQEFGFEWATGNDRHISGYAEPGIYTPARDSGYVFDPEVTKVLLLGLHLRDTVMIHGPSGCGKSTLVEQISARLNYNVVRVNFDGGVTRTDLVGQWVLNKAGGMDFMDGILPLAMRLPGTILLLDEFDALNEDTAFVLQRVLEEPSKLLLLEKGGELISLHPDNAILATGNTAGMGDESGLYSGTRVRNFAQMNRFRLTVEADYLSAEQEISIVLRKYEDVERVEATAMVAVVNAVRQAYKASECATPLTTRDLCNWAEKYLCFDGDAMRAAKYCFLNRMPAEDRALVREIIDRCFE